MPNDESISLRTINEVRQDTLFQEQCLGLLQVYYLNPDVPLRYAIDHESTHVYVSHSSESLIGVFFARLPEKIIAGLPSFGYMGLTVTSPDQGQGSARQLWVKYLDHARESTNGYESWGWYRTASPFGLFPCHSLLKDGEPRPDGSFSDKGELLIRALRKRYQLISESSNEHPFVVRRYASARYSEFERNRIQQFGTLEAIQLLQYLSINEEVGDRLLMLGRIS